MLKKEYKIEKQIKSIKRRGGILTVIEELEKRIAAIEEKIKKKAYSTTVSVNTSTEKNKSDC